MFVDFNHQSGFIYGHGYPLPDANQRINAAVDRAMVEDNRRQRPRDYLGASRIGEPCARKLVFEFTHTSPDPNKAFDGGILRVFVAFTGKAALVMSRKGTPASTIHSLIYRVSEATPQEIEKVKKDIAKIKESLSGLGAAERLLEESRLKSLEIRLADIHKPTFVLNEQSIVRDADDCAG